MIFSKTCNYALRALFYVTAQENRKFVSIRKISEHLGVSFYYLTKIFQILNQKYITISFKGAAGGVALAKPASLITIAEIVYSFDELKVIQECVFGFDKCMDTCNCFLDLGWEDYCKHVKFKFEKTSLEDIVRNSSSLNFINRKSI